MDKELRAELIAAAFAYADVCQCAISTVSRRCRNDSGFFQRLADPSKSITLRTYDEVMQWFSNNWPEDALWPKNTNRPAVSTASSPSPDDSNDRAAGSSTGPISQILESPPTSRVVDDRLTPPTSVAR